MLADLALWKPSFHQHSRSGTPVAGNMLVLVLRQLVLGSTPAYEDLNSHRGLHVEEPIVEWDGRHLRPAATCSARIDGRRDAPLSCVIALTYLNPTLTPRYQRRFATSRSSWPPAALRDVSQLQRFGVS